MKRIKKWCQKLILDSLITNPPPMMIVLLCVFGSVFSIGFWCAHWIDEINLTNYRLYNVMSDNIQGDPVLNIMNDLLPVDVVYTWVNGTDPYVVDNLKQLANFEKFHCSYANCFPSSYYALEKIAEDSTYKYQIDLNFVQSSEVYKGNHSMHFDIFHQDKDLSSEKFMTKLKSKIKSPSLEQAHWTTDMKVHWSLPWKRGLVIKVEPTSEIHVEISNISPKNYENFVKNCTIDDHSYTYVVECSQESLVKNLMEDIQNYINEKKRKYPLVWEARLVLHFEPLSEEFDVNRFKDNEELRYSLRSLEKFAPWVRRIFLVTNGQIPHWLNLDHPRISIVTHNQIFTDGTHLPTFSSPAIETHIHRIPGLSQHFLYLNDDILLGDNVWSDDFYTPSTGYKVYLAWSLPECSKGCLASWLNDGYCDRACNTTSCNWDGGDCSGSKDLLEREGSYYVDGEEDPFFRDSEFCSQSCSDSWLADSYCDAACSSPSCGFDAGDCGLEVIKENLLQLPFEVNYEENITLALPKGALSTWIDIRPFIEKEKNSSLKGNYFSVKGVCIVAANVPLGALIFVFKPNVSGIIAVQIGSTNKQNGEQSRKVFFYVKFNTYPVNLTSDLKENLHFSQTNDIINFHFESLSPKILKSAYNLRKNESFFNYSNSELTSEVVSEVKALHKRYMDGELTEKGFKWKKLSLINDRAYPKTNQLANNETAVLNNLAANRTLSLMSRKLLNIDSKFSSDFALTEKDEFLNSFRGKFSWDENMESIWRARGNNVSLNQAVKTGRKLLNAFSDSLLFVNRLFNLEYGFQARRVPAHMPHFINKEILQELQDKFSQEFRDTSSHKIRQENDMQFSFSYFYYLMSEKREKSIHEIFDEFDTDLSGTWSDREIRTFLTKINELPLQYKTFVDFHNDIRNCSEKVQPKPVPTPPYERYADSDVPTVSKELVVKCRDSILQKKIEKLKKIAKFSFSAVSDSVVHFKMITSNVSKVVHELDDVRKNPRKFICLNSDLDPRNGDNDLVRALMQDTYESLYPIPSSFELPVNYRNRFAYTWQLEEWRRWKNLIRSFIYAFLSCLILLTLTAFFGNEIESIKRKWCKRRRRKEVITARV